MCRSKEENYSENTSSCIFCIKNNLILILVLLVLITLLIAIKFNFFVEFIRENISRIGFQMVIALIILVIFGIPLLKSENNKYNDIGKIVLEGFVFLLILSCLGQTYIWSQKMYETDLELHKYFYQEVENISEQLGSLENQVKYGSCKKLNEIIINDKILFSKIFETLFPNDDFLKDIDRLNRKIERANNIKGCDNDFDEILDEIQGLKKEIEDKSDKIYSWEIMKIRQNRHNIFHYDEK